jgi:hypothetical protein
MLASRILKATSLSGLIWWSGAALAQQPQPYDGCQAVGVAKIEEVKQLNLLKNRETTPAAGRIDQNVTLSALTQPGEDSGRWDSSRAATITGYVVDVKVGGIETCNCKKTDPGHRDTHIELLEDPNDDAPERRVIVEVTPRWRPKMLEQGTDWSTDALKTSLIGQWVTVTGWLLFDSEHKGQSFNTAPDGDSDWRATAWELHPITSLELTVGPLAIKGTKPSARVAGAALVEGQVKAVHSTPYSIRVATADRLADFGIAAKEPPPGWATLKEGDLVKLQTIRAETGPAVTSVEVKQISTTWPMRLLALAVSGLLFYLLSVWILRHPFSTLAKGEDGRYSTSKFQMLVWFGVLVTTYLATILIRGVQSGGALIGAVDIPRNLLLISGLSALTFAGAKTITMKNVATGKAGPKTALAEGHPPTASFPGDLVDDDDGNTDFAKFQVVVITALAVAVYFTNILDFLGSLPLSGSLSLPDVDVTILSVFGLGSGAYLANKLVSTKS